MRLLQLSDPHLLADPRGCYRDRQPLALLERALLQVGRQPHDLLLISGDLCQDETWQGYVRLRRLLERRGQLGLPPVPVALLPGNHDHPALLRAALGRQAQIAPAVVERQGSRLVLLDSHRAGCVGGWIGKPQLAWLAAQLAAAPHAPTLVAVHHPPVPIGDAGMDAIGLHDGPSLLAVLRELPGVRAVLFGHVHQHWQGLLPDRPAALEPVELLGCPSTLCAFGPVQPCPLGRPQDPGGRWLQLADTGLLLQRLLRWHGSAEAAPSVCG
jgi:Icc protein